MDGAEPFGDERGVVIVDSTHQPSPLANRLLESDPERSPVVQINQVHSLAVNETSKTALSRRELEVLSHIQLGLTNRQIAQRLFVSTNTVNKHVQQVLRKLEVSNRVQAAIYARTPVYEHLTGHQTFNTELGSRTGIRTRSTGAVCA